MTTNPQPTQPEQTMLKVNGKRWVCPDCGANVQTKVNDHLWTCNGCACEMTDLDDAEFKAWQHKAQPEQEQGEWYLDGERELETKLHTAEQQAQKAEDLVAKLTMQLFDMSLQSRENRKQAQTLRTTLIAAHRTLTYILMNEAAPIEIKESRIRRDLDLIDAALNPSFPEKDVGASEELSIERATKELIKRGKDMIESSPKS
jgi:hypothetical protein